MRTLVQKLNRHLDELLQMDDNMLPQKQKYSRPEFLKTDITNQYRKIFSHSSQLSEVINFGYAETNNIRGSFNEDQSCVGITLSDEELIQYSLKTNIYYFAIFDGHLGWCPSLYIREAFPFVFKNNVIRYLESFGNVNMELVLPGLLEKTYNDLDSDLNRDIYRYNLRGGCTCLVCVIYAGKIYSSNAGDSRALAVTINEVTEYHKTPFADLTNYQLDKENHCSNKYSSIQIVHLTKDCSPINERQRIYSIIRNNPSIIDKNITTREYSKPVAKSDIGKIIFYRESHQNYWLPKIATKEDLRVPVINNSTKKGRILGRLGVARGFGNFRLKSVHDVPLKPFFSSQPDITKYNPTTGEFWPDNQSGQSKYHSNMICNNNMQTIHMVIMATDGIWDTCNDEQILKLINESLTDVTKEKTLELELATKIIEYCCGEENEKSEFKIKNSDKLASKDDLSAFVIIFK